MIAQAIDRVVLQQMDRIAGIDIYNPYGVSSAIGAAAIVVLAAADTILEVADAVERAITEPIVRVFRG